MKTEIDQVVPLKRPKKEEVDLVRVRRGRGKWEETERARPRLGVQSHSQPLSPPSPLE